MEFMKGTINDELLFGGILGIVFLHMEYFIFQWSELDILPKIGISFGMSIIALFFYYDLKNQIWRVSYPRDKKFVLVVVPILLIIIIISWTLGFIGVLPGFHIDYPANNAVANQIISIRGHGGVPHSEIIIWVIDDYGRGWKQNISSYIENGQWEVKNVNIGDIGTTDTGRSYEIYAILICPDGSEIQSNVVNVHRIN